VSLVPDRFDVMGREFRVLVKSPRGGNNDGETLFREGLVILYCEHAAEDYMEQTFFHEYAHILAMALGWEELNGDEARIDFLGALLHQLCKTGGYRIESGPTEVGPSAQGGGA
jgi:hypothetical protein